ncbi:MAG: hypothetical protein ACFCVF_16670 [Kineosporiaceae bacterium]
MAGIFRRWLGGRRRRQTFDREGTRTDLSALKDFATSRRGVEFYVEPETFATDTTAVAVAHDGEWIRRRVGDPSAAVTLARSLNLPLYRAEVTGYPQRMRDWSARNRDRGLR